MGKCAYCGSDKVIPYRFKPPKQYKGKHVCTPACMVNGTMCLNCRMVKG